jgi:L-rhamnonate dehydratase
MGQILVAVDTDAGLTGYGVGGGGASSTHLINHLLRDLIVGEDAALVETLWNRMYQATLPFGRKGLAIMAISGIDLALWDLRGKAANLPVARLLSDSPHESVPCYASLGTTPAQAIEQGFGAVKLHLKGAAAFDQDRIVAEVAAARQVVGPNVRLMTDAFMRWDVPTTLRLAEEFQKYRVEWIEEPLLPDDFKGYAELAAKCPIPIAGGEHEFTAQGFEPIAEGKLHAILQPDVTWCGGMTQLVQIYQLAEKHGLRVCQHRGAEIWGLHAVAALEPIDPLAEEGRSWMHWVGGQPPIENGRIRVPGEPGFGVVVDES